MKRILSLLVVLLWVSGVAGAATTVVTKGLIGEEDINHWDGVTSTFTRPASPGGTITLDKVGTRVDAAVVYGGGVLYTDATIQRAVAAIGTTAKVGLVLRPGTWTFGQSRDWSAYTNITFLVEPGAVVSYGAYTLNIPNPVAGRQQWLSGTGTVTFSGTWDPVPVALWFGANGEDSADDTAALTLATGATPVGGTLWIPWASVGYKGNLVISKNIRVKGEGIRYPKVFGVTSAPVFKFLGTSGTHLNGIEVSNLEIQNGTAQDPTTTYKEGVVVQYADNINFHDLYITEIQGYYGLVVAGVSGHSNLISRVVVYRYGGTGIGIFSNSENIIVEKCMVDTPLSTAHGDVYNYTLSNGGSWDIAGRTWNQRNITLNDCTALNNVIWSGLEIHGDTLTRYNIHVNNYRSENCARSVGAGNTEGLFFTNCKGVGIDPWPGVVACDGGTNGYLIASCADVHILGGSMTGFWYAVFINRCRGFVIDGCLFDKSVQYGVYIYQGSRVGKVINNIFQDIGSYNANYNYAVYVDNGWDIFIDKNITARTVRTRTIQSYTGLTNYYFLRINGTLSYVKLGSNSSDCVVKYVTDANAPYLHTTIPSDASDQVWARQGDLVEKALGTPGWACTNSDPRPLYFDSTIATGLTVSGTSGDYVVTMVAGTLDNIPDGMAISITGADTGAGDLSTTVVWVDRPNGLIYIKDAIVTTVTGAGTKYVSATWATYP